MTEEADIGLATVYRVLMQFEQAGLLSRSNFESGKSVFELNEGHHHDHLVCLDCGRVEEFYDSADRVAPARSRHGTRLCAAGAFAVAVRALHQDRHARTAASEALRALSGGLVLPCSIAAWCRLMNSW